MTVCWGIIGTHTMSIGDLPPSMIPLPMLVRNTPIHDRRRAEWRMVPKLGPTRIGGTTVSSFKSELEPQLDLRPENLPDDGGQPRSSRPSSSELAC